MGRFHRDDILFLALSTVIFLGICAVTYVSRMRLIYWSINNCGDSSNCVAADNLITYWWALFVPVLMLVAYLVNRVYQVRLVRRKKFQA